MVEILVCDDDREFAVLEKEVAWEVAIRYHQEVWIDLYQSGRDLLKALEKKEETKLCIVLLDINMPELTGYEVAKILNERFPEVLVLFVSNKEELVYAAFEYSPFRFIRKSHFMLEIRHALRKAFEMMERRMEKYIKVLCDGEIILLAHWQILYFLMRSRKVCFYLWDGRVLLVRGTMKGMLEKLGDRKMIQINSGCVINADQVESYTSNTVTIKGGERLPISRDRAKSVKRQIEENWRK